MSLNSINYNNAAAVALANLNNTSTSMAEVQNQISSGKIINGPKDDPAVWAMSARSTSDATVLDAVIQSLQRGQTTVDTAVSAATTVQDLLNQIKTAVVSATDSSLDTAARTQLETAVKTLMDQINRTVNNASFNGVNIVKTGGVALTALADASGSGKVTVAAINLSIGTGANGGRQIQITTGATFKALTGTALTTYLGNLLTSVNKSIANVTSAMAQMGTGQNALAAQLSFVKSMQSNLQAGVSDLVDADMTKESTQMQALQARQQLGVQALQIANSSKNSLLSLFR